MLLNISASGYLNGKKAEESRDRHFGGRTKSPKPRGAAALLSGGAAVAPPRGHLNSSRSSGPTVGFR
jgi:hypothetical protein